MSKSYTGKYFMSRLKKLRELVSRCKEYRQIELLLGKEVSLPDFSRVLAKGGRAK